MNDFVFVIFKKDTLEIFQIYFDEDSCVKDFEALKFEDPNLDWCALNVSLLLKSLVKPKN